MEVGATATDEMSYEWQWSKDGGASWYPFIGTGANTGTVKFPKLTSHFNGKMMRVLVRTDQCEVVSNVATIKWIDLPQVTFGAFGDTSVSSGNLENLSGGYPEGGHYSGPGVTDNGDGTYNFNPTVAGAGTHELTYNYENDNGCSNSASDMVYVSSPCSIAITEQPQDALVCANYGGGVEFRVTANGPATLSYQWQYATMDQPDTWYNIIGALSSSYGATLQDLDAYYGIRVLVTSNNGTANNLADDCVVASHVAKVLVEDIPIVAISGKDTFCEGGSTELTASGGDSYLWNGPNGFAATSATVVIDEPGHYEVISINNYGCESNLNAVTVVAQPKPQVAISGPEEINLSSGLQYDLSGGLPVGGFYSGPGVTDDANGSTYTFDPSEAGIGQHNIMYTYTNDNGCTNSATYSLEVLGAMDAECALVISEQPTFSEECLSFGSTSSLMVTVDNPNGSTLSYNWQWAINGSDWTDIANANSNMLTDISFDDNVFNATMAFRVIVTSDNGTPNNVVDDCLVMSNEAVVFSLPEIAFEPPTGLAVDAEALVLNSGLPQGGSYSGNGVSQNANGTFSFDPSVAGLGSHDIIYSYQNDNGCTAEVIKAIEVTQPTAASAILINEFQPNPPGSDPSTQSLELKGPAGEAFTGWVVVLESDSDSNPGEINDVEEISGTFDANGLLVVTIDDVENPSFTLLITDVYTPGTTDFDSDDDGQLDTDISALGNVYDAIGVPDAAGDETYLYGAQLGGEDFKFTGTEPELIFRDSNTNAWYAINDHDGDMAHDVEANMVPFGSFSGSLEAPTFGTENPYRINTARMLSIRAWPNPATHFLHLEQMGYDSIHSFELYDMAGKLIRTVPAENSRKHQLDVQDLDTGVYMLRANTKNDGILNTRFIKRQ